MTTMKFWEDQPTKMQHHARLARALTTQEDDTMTTYYTTSTDARDEFVAAIESGGNAVAAEYDMDEIVGENITWDEGRQAFYQHTDTDEFWKSVEAHALDEFQVTFIEDVYDDQAIPGNTVGTMHILGWDDETVEEVTYSTPTPEEWEPTVYAEALENAGWDVLTLPQSGRGTVKRKEA